MASLSESVLLLLPATPEIRVPRNTLTVAGLLSSRGGGSCVDASAIPIGIAWRILDGEGLGGDVRRSRDRRST